MDLEDIIEIIKMLPKVPRLVISIIEELVRWYIIFQIKSAFSQLLWQINPFFGFIITLAGLISIFKWFILIYLTIAE